MKIIAAPDSFKGSMSALEAAKAIENGVKRAAPAAEVVLLPVADGGEGFTDAIVHAAGGEKMEAAASDPLGRRINAYYGIIDHGQTAVIEMAAASGLPLLQPDERNPMIASTYGTGELIRHALDQGCRRILIGLGGSATNDGGIGMAQALGYRFYDEEDRLIEPFTPQWLKLAKIDASQRDARLSQTEFRAACDVDAVLYGEAGASVIFGPQKGADANMVQLLDRALERLAQRLEIDLAVDVHELKGGGAAGGLGAGMTAFCSAKLVPGSELVLDALGFDQHLEQCDLVITGEGQTDAQSALGKVPQAIAARAKQKGVPAVCISGALKDGYEQLHECGMTALFSLTPHPCELGEAMDHAQKWMEDSVYEMMRLYCAIRRKSSSN